MAKHAKKPAPEPNEPPARQVVQHNGITLHLGDPSIDISDVPGIWADRPGLTKYSLRRKAWGYRRCR